MLSKLPDFILLAVVISTAVQAIPKPATNDHATYYHSHLFRREFVARYQTFAPASTFETYGLQGVDHPLSARDSFALEDAATEFVKSKHPELKSNELEFHSGFTGEAGKYAYVKQTSSNISFVNAVANVAFNSDGKVTSFGTSLMQPTSIANPSPSVSVDDAVKTAEQALGGKRGDQPTSLMYVVQEDRSVVLTHAVPIQDEDAGMFVEAYVDAHANKLVSVTNFVSELTYWAVPIVRGDPTQGFDIITNPESTSASPRGWVSGTNTVGNNAVSYKGSPTTGTAGQSSPGNFIYVYSGGQSPTVAVNVNAALVNAFYVVNSIHDIAYTYGFNESAFNFQIDNFGKGGLGNDSVRISVQDSGGFNNGFFATQRDGISGQMTLYLYNLTNPFRDVAIENDFVSHEMTHGISGRLTGGGTATCLQSLESRGLGEGWSDAFADWLQQVPTIKDFVFGAFVNNNPRGIRVFPYSTSQAVNPLTYGNYTTLPPQQHYIGEIWANTLHNVLAALVDTYRWSNTALTNPNGTEGNVVYMHLFMDGLSIQPCNPTFIQARDSFILADFNRYKGIHACTIWRAFASRGLGYSAANYVNDFTLPPGC